MKSLSLSFQNCFDIQLIRYTFSFVNGNVFAIYAKNGLMKTSFAKTFKMLQEGKIDDICDVIFDKPGTVEVTIDNNHVEKDQIFVIKSYESSYEILFIKIDFKNFTGVSPEAVVYLFYRLRSIPRFQRRGMCLEIL